MATEVKFNELVVLTAFLEAEYALYSGTGLDSQACKLFNGPCTCLVGALGWL